MKKIFPSLILFSFFLTLDLLHPSPSPSPGPSPAPFLQVLESGDYNSELAVFRPSSGLWAVRDLGRSYFGRDGDLPVTR
jgi:hypothetical protein